MYPQCKWPCALMQQWLGMFTEVGGYVIYEHAFYEQVTGF